MRNTLKRVVVILFVLAVSVIWLSGCVYNKQASRYEPVSVKNAAIGINVTPDGKLIFVDENGEVVKPIPLKEQIDIKYKKGEDWKLEELSTITVYHVSGSHELWFVQDGRSICYLYSDDWTRFLGRCH